MLVVLSDIHLTDGTTSSNVHETAFKTILLPEIAANAVNKKATEINVVLLGDIFDLLRTEYWVDKVPENERPWSGELSPDTGMNANPAVERHYNKVLDDILQQKSGMAFCEVLGSIKAAVRKETGKDITVKITCVVGNHDRALNAFESLREAIKRKFANINVFDFASVVTEPEYGVHARHGHEWDEHNHGYDFYRKVLKKGVSVGRFDPACYKVQTIGEVVTAELMAGLIWRLKKEFQDREFMDQLREVNNVRPMFDVFLWLEWFGRRRQLTRGDKDKILKSLTESIDAVLETDLAKKWDDLVTEILIFRGDLTDRLKHLNRYLKSSTFDNLKGNAQIVKFFEGIFGSSRDDYVKGALQEYEDGLPSEIQYVLYGHTHDARQDFFSGDVDGSARMYINTGTYLPLIQSGLSSGFVSSHRMTMAFFYNRDEDREGKRTQRPSMELWNGMKRKDYISG